MEWGTQIGRRVKLAALLALLALTLIGTTPVLARVITVTTNEREPIDLTIDNPCTGEPIALSGTVHRVTTATIDTSAGTIVFTAHANYQDVSGVGLISGVSYQFTAPFNTIVALGMPPSELTTTEGVQLIGQGPSDNFVLKMLLHITANANGEVTTSIDKISSECRG